MFDLPLRTTHTTGQMGRPGDLGVAAGAGRPSLDIAGDTGGGGVAPASSLAAFRVGLVRAQGNHSVDRTGEAATTHDPTRYRSIAKTAGGGRPADLTAHCQLLDIDVHVARCRVGSTVKILCRLQRTTPTRYRCPRASAATPHKILAGVTRGRRIVRCRGHRLSAVPFVRQQIGVLFGLLCFTPGQPPPLATNPPHR